MGTNSPSRRVLSPPRRANRVLPRSALGRRRTRGFTLLELVVATTILVTVLMICYQILGSTLEASDRIERRARPDKVGEAVMALIRRDLQGAIWYHLGDVVFLGEDFGTEESARDTVHFLTTSKPIFTAGTDSRYQFWTGVTSVSYYVRESPETGLGILFRRESIDLGDAESETPFQAGTPFEIYDKVQYLNILYFDGYEWLPDWDSAVRREDYEIAMDEAIQNLLDEATSIEGISTGTEANARTAGNASSRTTRTGTTSRTASGNASLSGALAGAEGEEDEPTNLLPLPDWALPKAVRIELGIYAGNERGLYRGSSDPDAPPTLYTYSATVVLPSASVARLTADVPETATETGAGAGTTAGGAGGMPGGVPSGTVSRTDGRRGGPEGGRGRGERAEGGEFGGRSRGGSSFRGGSGFRGGSNFRGGTPAGGGGRSAPSGGGGTSRGRGR